jgi:carbonic anhydrase
MKSLDELVQRNRAWAARRTGGDPRFFEKLTGIQRPDYLWIGCADSRVPANEIVGLEPGELFVHRNVANLVVPGDPNCMAVVQYAVEVLGVREVIVCGHYGCGGVGAVLDPAFGGAGHVERWLAPLRDIAAAHAADLAPLTPAERWARLCEVNVIEQARRLTASDVLVQARLQGISVSVHPFIYSLEDGLLRELRTLAPPPDRDLMRR